MTNYEHLVETGELAELIMDLISEEKSLQSFCRKWGLSKVAGGGAIFCEAVSEWLQASPKEYVAVEDIKKFFGDPRISVWDHSDSISAFSAPVSVPPIIGVDEILNRLHIITEDEIKGSEA